MWAARETQLDLALAPPSHPHRRNRPPQCLENPLLFLPVHLSAPHVGPRRERRPSGGTTKPIAEHGLGPCLLPPFPSHRVVFGTARSGPGRAECARRRRIFCGFEKILRSGPWTARTVLQRGAEGKGGQPTATFMDARVSKPRLYSPVPFTRGPIQKCRSS